MRPHRRMSCTCLAVPAWTAGWRRWRSIKRAAHAGSSPACGTERAEAVLASQGIIVPTTADMARTLMVDHLGVPADAVEVLRDPMDNTAHEAVMIEARARRDGWTRIVVITTRAATRRAGYAFRRVLGDDIQIVMRDTRYDDYDAVWWWRTRGDFRQTFIEFPKLMAYWLGLGA